MLYCKLNSVLLPWNILASETPLPISKRSVLEFMVPRLHSTVKDKKDKSSPSIFHVLRSDVTLQSNLISNISILNKLGVK